MRSRTAAANEQAMTKNRTTFQRAVETTPQLETSWKAGLRALASSDRDRVTVQRPARLEGSLNLDRALATHFPHARRWDYGIGYRDWPQQCTVVYWIEVHPANAREVRVVLEKLTWLQQWLRGQAPKLHSLAARFVWISSGKTSLLASSPEAKRLAKAGIRQAGGHFTIADD